MNRTIILITLALVFIILEVILIRFYPSKKEPIEFKYKNHEYIYFPSKGVVHSPDCKQCILVFD